MKIEEKILEVFMHSKKWLKKIFAKKFLKFQGAKKTHLAATINDLFLEEER